MPKDSSILSYSRYGALVNQLQLMEHSLNQLPEGMLVMDHDLRVLFANTEAGRLLGVNAVSLKDQFLLDICPELAETPFIRSCKDCLATIQNVNSEVLLGPENQAFSLEIKPCPAGIEIYLKKNFRQNTDSTSADKSSSFLYVLEYLQDGIMNADPVTRRITYANRAICRMLGYSREELESMQIADLHPDSEKPRIIKDFKRLKSGSNEPLVDVIFRRKDGSLFPCDIYGFFMDYNGKPSQWAIFKDVTERKLAREEMVAMKRQVEEKTQLAERAQKIARLGYWELDLKEKKLSWSDETFIMFGYKPGSIEPTSELFMARVHPDDRQQVADAFETHLHDKNEYNVVFRVNTVNGQTKFIHERCLTVQDENGVPVRSLGVIMDIGYLKEAEEKIRRQEERLSQLARQSRNFAWEVDENGLYTYVSPVVTDVLGYNPEELTGKMFFYELHPEEGREEFKKAALDVFRIKETFTNLENKALSKDGKAVWLLTNGMPLLQSDGTLYGYRGSDTDITQRKNMEEALRNSEENFRQIANNIEEVFWLRSADNSVMLYVNKAYQKVFGRTCESLYSNPASFLDAIHPDDLGAVLEAYRGYFSTHIFFETFRIIRPNGEIRWLQSRSNPVRNEKGEINGHTGMAVDITDRKLQEESLKNYSREIENSNTLLNTLLNTLPDLIWLKDKDGKYIRSNQRFESFIGLSPEELIYKTDYDLFPEELARFFREHDEQAVKHGGQVMNEEWIQFADGHRELLETIKTPMHNTAGKFIGVLGIGHDITHRKQAEETLRMERDLFSEGPVFTITWDSAPEWPVLNVSKNVEKIIGYSPDELKHPGFRYASLIHPDDIERIQSEVKFNIENNINSFEQSYRLQLKSGEYRWFYDFTRFIRDDENNIKIIRGYLIDQTAQREMESALFEKNKQLNLIVQNVPGAVFSYSGPEKRDFLFLSKFISEITGYEPEELQAYKTKLFNELIHPDDLRLLRRAIRKAHIHKENYSYTYRIRHKNESWKWVYETGEFQTFEGRYDSLRVDGILFDMTDKIMAEEEKLNAVYKAADDERTRISREIHDGLQQTMVAGKLNMEMLKDEISHVNPVLQERYLTGLQFLEQAVQEARTISHSLMPKQVHDFGFVAALENMLTNLDRKIEFKFYHNDVVVKNDNVSLNLFRIIQEAISNIIKHAQATRVDINLTAEENRLNLTIEDNGNGFRIHENRGPERGMGLQSMKSRAASIGATLELYSEPGQGTLIVIELEQ